MQGRWTRRGALAAGGAWLAPLAAQAAAPASAVPASDGRAEQDFDELWRTLKDRYCFFEEKATDWAAVRRLYRPLAIAARTEAEFQGVLGRVLSELYDPHTRLDASPEGSPRFPPFDLWTEPRGGEAVVVAVMAGSGATEAGLRAGDVITHVEGLTVAEATAARRPRCLRPPDPEAELYALQTAVAGIRGRDRRLTVRRGAEPARQLVVGRPAGGGQEASVSHRRLDGGFGYIRIAGFAEEAAVERFDRALAELAETRGLVLDVRRNGGGDTAVARPIMGRFISERRPYAKMRRRQGRGLGPAWTEFVDPRGPFTYGRPVVVLTDRWSASMAEGFPMGLRSLVGARIVGTPMQGLGAAVYALRLDRTGVQAQYSAEPVYAVDGAPRWRLRPDVTAAQDGDTDGILSAGLAELRRLTGR